MIGKVDLLLYWRDFPLSFPTSCIMWHHLYFQILAWCRKPKTELRAHFPLIKSSGRANQWISTKQECDIWTNKGASKFREVMPILSINAICSTYLNNNFVLSGMLLIYEVDLVPKPLPYYRLNHYNRFILKSTWKKMPKALYWADGGIVIYLVVWITSELSVYLGRGCRKGHEKLRNQFF